MRPRPPTTRRCRGAVSTSARRSTTAARASSTWPEQLPAPGRDGLGPAHLDEIVDLVDAAGGRTLGLFSSRRAAEAAAEVVRERLPHLTTLVQGEAQLPELSRQFVEDPHTCLFGTLSLWQGLDVPGDTCQLVLIDRIPFPRPDDPLMSARQRAADRAGGNGFMQVAATHAALLLAQGCRATDPHHLGPRGGRHPGLRGSRRLATAVSSRRACRRCGRRRTRRWCARR